MALSRSQRLTLIKEIADRLSRESRAFINATLKQFGLPRGPAGGYDHPYVLAQIEDAKDQELIELADHLGFTVDFEPSLQSLKGAPVECKAWRSGAFRLFLSHLAKEREYAAELQEHLTKYGISCFVAHEDIKPTREWQDEIEAALATCDALLALLHPGFHESLWTDQEIGYVMGRGLPAFAVRLGEEPYALPGVQWSSEAARGAGARDR